MTPAGTPDDGVNVFLVGGDVLFSHYFEESQVFAALKPYYNNRQYRFEVPIAVFPNVLGVLVRHGYEVTYHRDASDFVVAVKQYSQHPEDIFKQSVDHRSVDDWNCFLLQSRAAVEQAIRTHARPVANAPVRNPFDFAIRTDGIPREEGHGITRLSLAASRTDLADRFDVAVPDDYGPRYNVSTGAPLATITNERPGELAWFHWGLVPFWADGPDEYRGLLTAPAATIDEAPMVAEAFRHRRCLVLTDGFYTWKRAGDAGDSDAAGEEGDVDGDAEDSETADDETAAAGQTDGETSTGDPADGRTTQPYRITTPAEQPFAIAAVWEVWAAGDARHLSVGLVTTAADEAMRDVTERVPVILDEDAQARWLDAADTDQLGDALSGESAPDLRLSPVSRAVVDPGNDGPGVAEAVDTSRQVGLDAFSGAEK